MKVISPYRDAYDSILWNLEADPRSVWKRYPWIVTDQADEAWLERLKLTIDDLTPFLAQSSAFLHLDLPPSLQNRSFLLTVFLAGRRFPAIYVPGQGYFYDPAVLMQKLESYPDPTGKEKKRGASWKSRSTGSRAQSAWEYITDHSVQPALLQALLKLETPLLLVYTEPGLHTQSLSPVDTFYRALLPEHFPPKREAAQERPAYGQHRLTELSRTVVIGNPVETVRGIQFARALPLEQIAQEIRMFFDGIVSRRETAVTITDDRVLRDAKGFGNCSFKSCHLGKKLLSPEKHPTK